LVNEIKPLKWRSIAIGWSPAVL